MPMWIMPWISIALVLLGFVVAAAAVRRRLGPPACRRCGYSMEALGEGPSLTCPECGRTGGASKFRARRVRRARMAGAGLLLGGGVLAWYSPALTADNFAKQAPTWVLMRLPLDRAAWVDEQLGKGLSPSRWFRELDARMATCSQDQWDLWLDRVSRTLAAGGPEVVLDDGTAIWLRLMNVSEYIEPSDALIEAVPNRFGFVCGNSRLRTTQLDSEPYRRPREDKAVHARIALRVLLTRKLDYIIEEVDGSHGSVQASCDGWLLIRASESAFLHIEKHLTSGNSFASTVTGWDIAEVWGDFMTLPTVREVLFDTARDRQWEKLQSVRDPETREFYELMRSLGFS